MSRKNHKMADGRLLRTDKTMRHLKSGQIGKNICMAESRIF